MFIDLARRGLLIAYEEYIAKYFVYRTEKCNFTHANIRFLNDAE